MAHRNVRPRVVSQQEVQEALARQQALLQQMQALEDLRRAHEAAAADEEQWTRSCQRINLNRAYSWSRRHGEVLWSCEDCGAAWQLFAVAQEQVDSAMVGAPDGTRAVQELGLHEGNQWRYGRAGPCTRCDVVWVVPRS